MYTKDELLTEVKEDLVSIDPDHTKAAREFYTHFWKDTLSGDILDYDGALGHYRGETILTFNTMSGCAIRLTEAYRNGLELPKTSEERLAIIMNQKDIRDFTAESFRKYHKLTHTLANFMPLVVGREHINLIKGDYTHNYHDMPDLFYAQVKIWYETGSNDREIFFDKANVEYFKRFKDWKGYVEGNYLQDYFTDKTYSTFIPLLPEIRGNMPKMPYTGAIAKKLTFDERRECFEQIDDFVTTAAIIIEQRAERLAKAWAAEI